MKYKIYKDTAKYEDNTSFYGNRHSATHNSVKNLLSRFESGEINP